LKKILDHKQFVPLNNALKCVRNVRFHIFLSLKIFKIITNQKF